MTSLTQITNKVGLGLGALLFAYQVWTGLQAFSSNSTRFASPFLFVMAAALMTIIYELQILTWSRLLMERLGVHISFIEVHKGYTLSGLVRYLPGGIWGYMSRSQWLYESCGIAYKTANAGSMLQLLGWLVSACTFIGGYWGFVLSGTPQVPTTLLALSFPLGAWLVIRNIPHWKFLRWISDRGLLDLASLSVPLRYWVTIVVSYTVLWAGYGSVMFLIIRAMGIQARGDALSATFFYLVAWLIGFLIVFMPAGLGIREVVLSSLLVTGMGISLEYASAISVLTRFLILLAELEYLLVGLLLLS